jgi:type II secretory pathway component PulC
MNATPISGLQRRAMRCAQIAACCTSLLFAGCGGSAKAPVRAANVPVAPRADAQESKAKPGHVLRADVVRTADAGVGGFLHTHQLEVAPELRAGRFVGWRVTGLRQSGFGNSVDVRTGDVVRRVNGLVLERPEDADAALKASRARAAVDVVLERDGHEVQVHVPIDE